MNAEETKSFIKKFYETLYEKFRDVSEVLIKIPIVEGNEPMWEEGSEPDKDGWVTWRLLPAQVSDDEIAELEAKKEDLAVERARLTSIAASESSTVASSMEDANVEGYAE